MVPQDGLILSPSDLPLEPRLRLAVVGDLQRGRAVANLGQVRHGVSDRDGPVDPAVASVDVQLRLAVSSEARAARRRRRRSVSVPGHVGNVFLVVHHHV